EDHTITDARQRLLHFRQHDHVRLYGRDFRDRLCTAALDVHEYIAFGQEAIENGLVIGDKIFVCTKANKKRLNSLGLVQALSDVPSTPEGGEAAAISAAE